MKLVYFSIYEIIIFPKEIIFHSGIFERREPKELIKRISLPVDSLPKRTEYITLVSRLKSFIKWPVIVNQQPQTLAEAGFYFCGMFLE